MISSNEIEVELNNIVSKYNNINSFDSKMNIWEDIAININNTKGKNRKYWCKVMELYDEKIR